MGIYKFHKWLRQNYPDSISTNLNKYDHIYFDMNACLHLCSYNSKTEDKLIKNVSNYIKYILFKLSPSKSVTIVSDGSAPMAKLLLQRKRRLEISRKVDINSINPLLFTPGTKFMSNLDKLFEKLINSIKELYNIEVILDFNSPGEGEVKILNHIDKNNSNESHLIVSNDADTIVLANLCKNYDKVNVACGNNSKIEIINIKRISEKYKYKDDFSFLALLNGNDYLPKLAYTNFDKIIDIYKNINKQIVKDNIIDKEVLKLLISQLLLKVNKGYLKNYKLSNFNKKVYDNYMEGLQWCYLSYKNSCCVSYNFMINHKCLIHPLGLYWYLIFDNKNIVIQEDNNFIENKLYAYLVMPKKGLCLLDKNYNIKELDEIYQNEECDICDKYVKELSDLNASNYLVKTDEDYKKEEKMNMLQKLKIKRNEYKEHKNIHKKVTKEDIQNIIKQIVI